MAVAAGGDEPDEPAGEEVLLVDGTTTGLLTPPPPPPLPPPPPPLLPLPPLEFGVFILLIELLDVEVLAAGAMAGPADGAKPTFGPGMF